MEALAAAGLGPGDVLEVSATKAGEVALRRAENPYQRVAGALTGIYPAGYLGELRSEWR